jgi:NADH-quinone oxidoreductase subunit C
MALSNQDIQEKLSAKFGEAVSDFTEPYGMLTFEVNSQNLFELVRFLRDDETLRFNFLTTICGMHHPENATYRQFAVVYHLHNWVDNVRIRVKTYLNADNPEVDSVVSLFASANWQERETYDFFGITFNNHPDLRRILNMDEMVSFPLRKEFPLEDQGRTDKDDRYFGRTPLNANLN